MISWGLVQLPHLEKKDIEHVSFTAHSPDLSSPRLSPCLHSGIHSTKKKPLLVCVGTGVCCDCEHYRLNLLTF